MKPPKTTRFCVSCDKNTKFQYNKNINHSECTECGSRYARSPRDQMIELNDLLNYFNKRIDMLKSERTLDKGMIDSNKNFLSIIENNFRAKELKFLGNAVAKLVKNIRR